MNNLAILILSIAIAVGIILFFIKKWMGDMQQKSSQSDEMIAWLKEMGNRIDTSTQNVDQKLSQNMVAFNERLDKAAFVIGEVQKQIGAFSEIGRGMKDLQDLLQSRKLRGNIGEQILKDLLSQFLPKDALCVAILFQKW